MSSKTLAVAAIAVSTLLAPVTFATAAQNGIASVSATLEPDAPDGSTLLPSFGLFDVFTSSTSNTTNPRLTDGLEYFSVQANQLAVFLTSYSNAVDFLWGTPDDYNLVQFWDTAKAVGQQVVASIDGSEIGSGATFRVGLTTQSNFNVVTFTSSSDRGAFEFDDVNIKAVPGPIAGAGLPVLMAFAGYLAWRRRAVAA